MSSWTQRRLTLVHVIVPVDLFQNVQKTFLDCHDVTMPDHDDVTDLSCRTCHVDASLQSDSDSDSDSGVSLSVPDLLSRALFGAWCYERPWLCSSASAQNHTTQLPKTDW
jgi:hypothetical protein